MSRNFLSFLVLVGLCMLVIAFAVAVCAARMIR
jgi:hypothetical protein